MLGRPDPTLLQVKETTKKSLDEFRVVRIAAHDADTDDDTNAPRPVPEEQDTDNFETEDTVTQRTCKEDKDGIKRGALRSSSNALTVCWAKPMSFSSKRVKFGEEICVFSANIDKFESSVGNEIAGFMFREEHVKEQGLVKTWVQI